MASREQRKALLQELYGSVKLAEGQDCEPSFLLDRNTVGPPQRLDLPVHANDVHLGHSIRRKLCGALQQAVDAGTLPSFPAMRSM